MPVSIDPAEDKARKSRPFDGDAGSAINLDARANLRNTCEATPDKGGLIMP
ncbi:hypothetical protein ACSV5M_02610 [Cellvibrio sp. ARAG 10.3]|jgi:hypothetical protein|uniref:hypothetical protein n=1 Tax=Cellvibrio sp. ARAG 10.3 TaxID=3451358 RepID=UPI003F46E91E